MLQKIIISVIILPLIMGDENSINESLQDIFKECNIEVRDIINLREAFTHSSYAHEMSVPSNERLEFLGDAVIELITRDYLFNLYSDEKEGKLTQLKSRIVSRGGLAFFAEKINLWDEILLGSGENDDDQRARKTILSQTMEALMGAIYISIGYEKSFNFFVTLLSRHLNELMSSVPILDPKSRLQIVTQEKYELLPVYYTFQIDEGFASEVFINDTKLGDGTGKSKRDAEKEAAKKALRNIEDNDFKI